MFVSPLPLIIYSKNLRMTLNFEKLFNKISYKIKYDNCIYLGHLGYMLLFFIFFYKKKLLNAEWWWNIILPIFWHFIFIKVIWNIYT